MYAEDDYLMLNGIQHFLFCKRQWALIHVENIWTENSFTAEGQVIHTKVDKPFIKEKRKDLIISRAMSVSSKNLGLSGRLDAIEFHKLNKGIELNNRKGLWQPIIIEYKRGKKKKYNYDNAQLMAQAICVEENFNTKLDYGYIYYNETDTREKVEFTNELRELTISAAKEMHQYYKGKIVPRAENYKNCKMCSLYNECSPRITKKIKNVDNYIYGAELWKNYWTLYMSQIQIIILEKKEETFL